MRIGGTLRIIFLKMTQIKISPKGSKKMLMLPLKILDRDKNQNNIFRSSWIFILAIWINSINICIGNILVISINICPKIVPFVEELWNITISPYKNLA